MTRGIIGAVAGVICIVVAVVWKIGASRLASRIVNSRKAAQPGTDVNEESHRGSGF